jgi:hypothetical protein
MMIGICHKERKYQSYCQHSQRRQMKYARGRRSFAAAGRILKNPSENGESFTVHLCCSIL